MKSIVHHFWRVIIEPNKKDCLEGESLTLKILKVILARAITAMHKKSYFNKLFHQKGSPRNITQFFSSTVYQNVFTRLHELENIYQKLITSLDKKTFASKYQITKRKEWSSHFIINFQLCYSCLIQSVRPLALD